MSRVVEVRTYSIRQGCRDEFHQLVVEKSIPMLARWKVDVIAFGASLHDDDSYFLIRSYADLAERETSQDAFYSSAEWREGPREAIVSLIENDISVVISMSEAHIAILRSAAS